MAASIINTLVQGVLIGGLYALFALGLSLSVGVMRAVNVAHGDFIVLVSYLLLTIAARFEVNIFVALAVVLPITFLGGYVLQRYLLQYVTGKAVLAPLLVTFGLAIITQNGLLEAYGAYPMILPGGKLETEVVSIFGFELGLMPLLTFAAAVGLIFLLDRLLYRSQLGSSIRAVSDDVAAAGLIGLSSNQVYALAMGIVGVTVAVAACFMGLRMNFDPSSGPSNLLIAFESVVLGGLGSLWGTLAGGIVLGIAQGIGGQIDFAWQTLAGHLVFLLVLALRPQGLFPKY
ncbi:Branched-chain amino acid ABC transporter permease [Methylocella tundrae]|uniref:Branched-chain amino acid ABC transporter permease n=1 Tax=Methylocella tundrae TaxID=227605 RepID=A0A8B6M8F5_METTU|nr:branched-chain amino acid ABC transporter permease [Methylocella tundrae]VTZ25833.1 Branched-chain amino acid ABC transporter permease [Methylocella tundrae]VTZ51156.1 Branched-chain amino acid ABC transporter permease [Methylocella tundrae]